MSRDSYAREKFMVAVDSLATGTGSINERLLHAWMSFHPVLVRDFSDPDNAKLYARIMERLTAVKDGDPENGYVKNTLAVMDEDTARAVAEDIVNLEYRLRD